MNKEVYAIETGKVELQAKTGLIVFKSSALSQEAFEDINDAIDWIESRYGSPERVGNTAIWQSEGTDNAYRIRFLSVTPSTRR